MFIRVSKGWVAIFISNLLRLDGEGVTKRKKAALCGCGLLENVAELSVQRCRRTRRDPSSSIERRRRAARRLVRFNNMTPPYRRMTDAVKTVQPAPVGFTGTPSANGTKETLRCCL